MGGGGVRLSIVIVSWNCAGHLRTCLASVLRSRTAFDFEVIVVDNASTDGTMDDHAVLRDGRVRCIALPENVGFAKANNLAFGVAAADRILLLNPDTILPDPDVLAGLMAMLDVAPGVAAAGPRLAFPDGRHQVGDAGYRPTPLTVVCHSLGLSVLAPRWFRGLFLGGRAAAGGAWLAVDWVCGACLLVRREVIQTVGGLDERFFLYGEDVEWGCRMRDAGLRVAYVPGVTVVHVQSGTQFQQPGQPVSTKWIDSLATLYSRLNAGRHRRAFRWAMTAGFGLRWAGYMGLSVASGRAHHRIKARAMATYGRHVLRLEWAQAAPRGCAGRPARRPG